MNSPQRQTSTTRDRQTHVQTDIQTQVLNQHVDMTCVQVRTRCVLTHVVAHVTKHMLIHLTVSTARVVWACNNLGADKLYHTAVRPTAQTTHGHSVMHCKQSVTAAVTSVLLFVCVCLCVCPCLFVYYTSCAVRIQDALQHVEPEVQQQCTNGPKAYLKYKEAFACSVNVVEQTLCTHIRITSASQHVVRIHIRIKTACKS